MNKPIETMEQLRAAMDADESEHLEFKSAPKEFSRNKLMQYCVAMCNGGGGNLVLGVSDRAPRKIVGTDSFRDVNEIQSQLLEALRVRIRAHEISTPEGRVLTFSCPSSKPGIPMQHRGRYLMRSGESLVAMTPDVLEEIMDERVLDYSETYCAEATMDDLAPAAIAKFRADWMRHSGNRALGDMPDAQLLTDAQLVSGKRITYAALILLAHPKSLSRLLPQAELIYEYRSDDVSIRHQDRAEYRAGYFLWKDDIWDKINSRNNMHSYYEGFFRGDIRSFDEEVVREALCNAVAHREYRKAPSIFVRHFPDRLEIISPGGFPFRVTADNILAAHAPRNRRIAEVFQHSGLVERAGQGVNLMFRRCIQDGKGCPDYSASNRHWVQLTLNGMVHDPEFFVYLGKLERERGMNLTLEDLLILDRIRNEDRVFLSRFPRLARLLDEGAVEAIGHGRGTQYIFSRELYKRAGRRGEYTRSKGVAVSYNRQLILEHIRSRNAEGATFDDFMQVLSGKSRWHVRDILKQLKEGGRIAVRGKGRGARWFLADE